ncbi:kinase-like protein [Fusarium bulbicola]|nr:kinase-like protein [Fusarium bulbicola]
MDPSMLLNHEEALAHMSDMTTQSWPITRSRRPLVGGFHPVHSDAEGLREGLTDTEARGLDGDHESDKVSLRRMKTEGSVTEFAPFNTQARFPTSGRIRNALRKEPTLGDRIIKATVQSAHPDYRSKKFLPRNEISRLLTTEAVEKELTQCNRWRRYPVIGLLRPRKPNFQEEAQIICGELGANPVCKTYQKIFAILVLLKRASLIVSFRDKVCDDDLPLKLGDKVNTNVLTVITKPAFAVKKIKPRKARIDPEYEAIVLRHLKDRHPNLISLLTTYKHHGDYHFIFPWAEADLKKYWQTINPKPSGEERDATLKWLGVQCKGLADGLSSIHRYPTTSSSLHGRFTPPLDNPVGNASENAIHVLFGRHGDLKPQNILWFPEITSTPGTVGGILKITDFGFSEFSSKSEVDRERRGFIANSPSYRAPEIDISTADNLIGPSYDIWALGCIYLEFLAWWLGGWDYVRSFANRRLDYDVALYNGRTERLRTDGFFFIVNFEILGKERVEIRKSVSKVSRSSIGVMQLSVDPVV